jgi:hypothetical protein
MKIILSRKGFDSSNGGYPSPIFPSGQMMSIPIPTSWSPTAISDLSLNGYELGKIIEELTKGSVKRTQRVHLDPDLDSNVLSREPGWHPAFGQTYRAQTHLENNGVGVGDLFLFFGWFREVELSDRRIWRYKPNAPHLHVIFGWLQVAETLRVGINTAHYKKQYPWLSRHPHLHGKREENNTIYVGADALSSIFKKNKRIRGGGRFQFIKESLILTEPGQHKRSVWKLPDWFFPNCDRAPLSCHENLNRWSRTPDGGTRLQSVARGQEFVLDVDQYPETKLWVSQLFE